jgi:hypothetical protein
MSVTCTTVYEYKGTTITFRFEGQTREEVERLILEQFMSESTRLLSTAIGEGHEVRPFDIIQERTWSDRDEPELVSVRLPVEGAQPLDEPNYLTWSANVPLIDGKDSGEYAAGDTPNDTIVRAIKSYIPGWYYRTYQTEEEIRSVPGDHHVTVYVTFSDGEQTTITVTMKEAVVMMLMGNMHHLGVVSGDDPS